MASSEAPKTRVTSPTVTRLPVCGQVQERHQEPTGEHRRVVGGERRGEVDQLGGGVVELVEKLVDKGGCGRDQGATQGVQTAGAGVTR
jgi:hypothetical protein